MRTEKQKKKDKALFVQRSLANGSTRQEIAEVLGYSNWRCLDIFMRRQGMKWDSKQQNYYLATQKNENTEGKPVNTPSKISEIISMFDKEGADPREIAKQAGFESHHQLAAYMAARGYTWSFEANNYVKSSENTGVREDEAADIGAAGTIDVRDIDISKYLPLLDMLLKNKERLYDLLFPASGAIPRYVVPGITRTKSFYMSDRLSKLIYEFSKSRNISQKEIIETAVIEFLRKYSFEKEVDELLGKNLDYMAI